MLWCGSLFVLQGEIVFFLDTHYAIILFRNWLQKNGHFLFKRSLTFVKSQLVASFNDILLLHATRFLMLYLYRYINFNDDSTTEHSDIAKNLEL